MINLQLELQNLSATFDKYQGVSCYEIEQALNINHSEKGYPFLISKGILSSYKGKEYQKYIFEKAKVVLKTTRLDVLSHTKESMSFPSFEYEKIVKEEWMTSELHTLFADSVFFFVVFKQQQSCLNAEKYRYESLVGHFFWKMPPEILETQIKKVWLDTQEKIKTGNIIRRLDENGNATTNFIGLSENPCCHVRPHGSCGGDVIPLTVPDKRTNYPSFVKECFWLNSSYINKIANSYITKEDCKSYGII